MHTAADPAWPALVGQIGRGGFCAGLLDVCQALAGASAVSLLHWPAGSAPRLLGAASHQPDAARLAGQRYLAHQHHRLDHQLRAPGLAPGQIGLCQQQAAQLPSARWREDCYATVGLASRLSLLLPGDSGCTVLNAYRPADCNVGEAQALDALDRHAALLAAVLRRHLELDDPSADPLAVLSHRERQVVDAILAGHSAKQAGRALGLSPTSVATYRQRAFTKLGVRRQVELFGLLSRRG
ncbi:MAG TPA: helix-turn-helix transcriptional regulator [Aquabacterium sp.]|nr:helix-turn-helix transcriptional regulator [Aquabacterium sp.]HQC96225.1 helix-turn-helix transcriptional regulator [Aquabacterium sp.]